ncbi:hypothetical protein [Streptomyces sp. RFCAC02]|nr:hypothetical protein [Streptomyces sp. RFCAC02]
MPNNDITELDTLISELDERITESELPEANGGGSVLCTIIVCNSVLCA